MLCDQCQTSLTPERLKKLRKASQFSWEGYIFQDTMTISLDNVTWLQLFSSTFTSQKNLPASNFWLNVKSFPSKTKIPCKNLPLIWVCPLWIPWDSWGKFRIGISSELEAKTLGTTVKPIGFLMYQTRRI